MRTFFATALVFLFAQAFVAANSLNARQDGGDVGAPCGAGNARKACSAVVLLASPSAAMLKSAPFKHPLDLTEQKMGVLPMHDDIEAAFYRLLNMTSQCDLWNIFRWRILEIESVIN
ncbi:hypothetical protein VKT23_008110 [Stygiomarasmius scandens]|uniref:Uncharacterized protein n=1 Tax=Marasmiellus scandens TaxID=2682957 RepID=A0ABR1JHX0_9AGAR